MIITLREDSSYKEILTQPDINISKIILSLSSINEVEMNLI